MATKSRVYTTHLTVAVDQGTKDWIAKEAEKHGVSPSVIVRWAVSEFRQRAEGREN